MRESDLTDSIPSERARSLSFQSIVPTLVVDGLCPYLTYVLLRRYVLGISEVMALGIGALFPLTRGIIEFRHRRRVDIIGTIVLIGVAVSAITLVVGGTPKLFLIRESFVTGALGLLALASLTWSRPLIFYVGRQFSAGDDPVALEQFNGLWQFPRARRTFRLMTLVWAVGWLGEFGLRIIMVLTLSVPQVLAISPFIFNGITVGLIAWTLRYARQQRKRGESLRASLHAPAVEHDHR